jgi:ABC-type transport system involved in cytochrome bd biosynthesis fused ATPase/permease subunit
LVRGRTQAAASLQNAFQAKLYHTVPLVFFELLLAGAAQLSRSQMTILIAHRLATIMHADVIYVLEKGKISESGSHDELLEHKGPYYSMWRQQVGERR